MKGLLEIIESLKDSNYKMDFEKKELIYDKNFMLLQVKSILESVGSFSYAFTSDKYSLNDEYYIIIYGKNFADLAYDGIAPAQIIETGYEENKNLGWGIIKW